ARGGGRAGRRGDDGRGRGRAARQGEGPARRARAAGAARRGPADDRRRPRRPRGRRPPAPGRARHVGRRPSHRDGVRRGGAGRRRRRRDRGPGVRRGLVPGLLRAARGARRDGGAAMSLPVVAVDGPAGAGKSTASRALARRLGFTHVDTGAMYRAVGVLARERGGGPSSSAPAGRRSTRRRSHASSRRATGATASVRTPRCVRRAMPWCSTPPRSRSRRWWTRWNGSRARGFHCRRAELSTRFVFGLETGGAQGYGGTVAPPSARIPPGGTGLMPERTEKPDRGVGAEDDFGSLFEQSLKSPKPGDVVT